jgi:hypothetical protein
MGLSRCSLTFTRSRLVFIMGDSQCLHGSQLPENISVVEMNFPVPGDEPEVFSLGLGNQHPIEWVAMMKREERRCANVCEAYLQRLHMPGPHELHNKIYVFVRENSPLSSLDAQFPKRGDADKDTAGAGLNLPDDVGLQSAITLNQPNEGVRIEQDIH